MHKGTSENTSIQYAANLYNQSFLHKEVEKVNVYEIH